MAAVAAALACAPAGAQACPDAAPSADSARAGERAPDVRIDASATAREVRFGSRPRATVRVQGCAAPDTVAVTERANLPDPVQPGVPYRDVRVGVQVRAWLDVRCAAALAAAEPALCLPAQAQANQTSPPAADPPAPAPPPR